MPAGKRNPGIPKTSIIEGTNPVKPARNQIIMLEATVTPVMPTKRKTLEGFKLRLELSFFATSLGLSMPEIVVLSIVEHT